MAAHHENNTSAPDEQPSGNVRPFPNAPRTNDQDAPSQALWDAIKGEYRSGLTYSVLSEKYGLPIPQIIARRKRDGWRKDLRQDVLAEAQARLAIDAIPLVSRENPSEEQIVEAAARVGAVVIKTHRNALAKHVAGLAEASDELQQRILELRARRRLIVVELASTDNAEALEAATKRLVATDKAIDALTGAQLNIANAFARVLPLERVAYGLNDKTEDKPYEERLREFYARQEVERRMRKLGRAEA